MKQLLAILALSCGCLAQSIPVGDSAGRLGMSNLPTGIGAQVPSGMIMLTLSANCPTGFTEVAALNGKFIQGTLAANSNVGTSGGSASITPTASSTTPTFSGTANQSDSAVSAGTPAGTIAWPASVPTNATASFTPAGTNTGNTSGATSAGTPAGTVNATATTAIIVSTGSGNNVAAQTHSHTFTGSSLATHTHSVAGQVFVGSAGTIPAEVISWPVAVPLFSGASLASHSHTFTSTGTVSTPAITVNAFDPSPAFIRVLFCSKN